MITHDVIQSWYLFGGNEKIFHKLIGFKEKNHFPKSPPNFERILFIQSKSGKPKRQPDIHYRSIMASRNADSMTNAQGEFHPRKPRDEPLQTSGVSSVTHIPLLKIP